MHGLQAINSMEFIVRALRGWAVPLVIPISRAWKVFDTQGEPRQEEVHRQLLAFGKEVVRAAEQFNREGINEYAVEGSED